MQEAKQFICTVGLFVRADRRDYTRLNRGGVMQIDIIFKIAAVGIIVTIVCQILKKSDRDDIATIVSLAGLIIVLTVVLDMIADLFGSIRSIFDLF